MACIIILSFHCLHRYINKYVIQVRVKFTMSDRLMTQFFYSQTTGQNPQRQYPEVDKQL